MKRRKIKKKKKFKNKRKHPSIETLVKQFAPLANDITWEKFCHKYLPTTEFN